MLLGAELFAIEEQFWLGGPEVYARYVDDHCLIAFAEMAGVMTKYDIAKSVERDRWQDVRLESKGVAVLADTAMMITYECHALRSDGRPYHAIVSSAYVNRDGEWKLAFHQQTEIAPPKKPVAKRIAKKKVTPRKATNRKQRELAL